ncbi:hypothetical protein NDU88_008852 [Pleurodeles waltl]|uniref:Uncharacterized protein n=1 Tax=Pleurodeles waltl TaxID=8319 RepID=A0AAV7RW09_PLEWA|nr:hypothetical protein NDU88_008852 [Pleurodeles waltl]
MALQPLRPAPASRASGRLAKFAVWPALAAALRPPRPRANPEAGGGRAGQERDRGRRRSSSRSAPLPARTRKSQLRFARSPRGAHGPDWTPRSLPVKQPSRPSQPGHGGRLTGCFERAGNGALKSSDRKEYMQIRAAVH